MTYYLASYRPLIVKRRGKSAIQKYGILPYVDDSIRREPDLESQFPSITAICRAEMFAPRLKESDTVVYITVKGNYPGYRDSHWRLTAILKVIKRFKSHQHAAKWYESRGLELPSNCIVPGNQPLSLDRTSNQDDWHSVRRWDAVYRKRTKRTPVFLACKATFLELNDPPVVTKELMHDVFGKQQSTRNPPRITEEQYEKLTAIADVMYAT